MPTTVVVSNQQPAISSQQSASHTRLRRAGLHNLESILTAFSEAIEAHEYLEIDDDFVEVVGAVREPPLLETHKLKIVNHDRRVAYAVSLQTILDYPLEKIIEALETGIFLRLYGVTRIVGYYSRIQNWNKSKLGELADRHKGNYRVASR